MQDDPIVIAGMARTAMGGFQGDRERTLPRLGLLRKKNAAILFMTVCAMSISPVLDRPNNIVISWPSLSHLIF